MTKLVALFPLEGGGRVLVQVDEEATGPVPIASPGELVAKAKMSFEQATAHIPVVR